MSAAIADSLWGELPAADAIADAPVTILKRQGAILTQKTRGILNGIVTQAPPRPGNFAYTLKIRVPALANYTVGLCSISHGISFYPIYFEDLVNEAPYGNHSPAECNDHNEFEKQLTDCLQSREVHRLISGLLAHVSAATDLQNASVELEPPPAQTSAPGGNNIDF